MMIADLRVIAERACDVVLSIPMREGVKTTAGRACRIPMRQEPMKTSL